MSKNKKKSNKNNFSPFGQDLQLAVAMIQTYLSEASTEDISLSLSNLGINTTSREEIFKALNQACPDHSFTTPPAFDKLNAIWKKEIEEKQKPIGFEEGILMLEASRHWVALWRTQDKKK